MKSLAFELLYQRSSLTDAFQALMGFAPKLTRLNQGHQMVSPAERIKLGIAPREYALVREIKMGNGEQDWLFARTVIPRRTLKGNAKRIAYLNDTPIGKILFGRHGAIRLSLEVSRITDLPEGLLEARLIAGSPASPATFWQRESIFQFVSGPLMVTEIFLPDCPIYDGSIYDGSIYDESVYD